MAKELFSSFRYVVGSDLTYENKRSVKVFLVYQGKHSVSTTVYVNKIKGESERYYIDEAKKIIQTKIRSGSLKEYSTKYAKKIKVRKHFLGIFVPIVAVATPSVAIPLAIINAAPQYNDSCPYLTFNAELDSKVSYDVYAGELGLTHLQYSNDKKNWYDWEAKHVVALKKGDKLYIQNTATHLNSRDNYICFEMLGRIAASGDISSLTQADTLQPYEYYYLFSNCYCLTRAPKLPAKVLADYCYSYMFNECYSLQKAPKLPATTVADGCYKSMFEYCLSLVETPEMSALTLTDYCCESMFKSCTNLLRARDLPATTIGDHCYANMFYDCSYLKEAPEIFATTLGDYCCEGMFCYCESLRKCPKILPAMKLANGCYRDMFMWCENMVEVPKLPATTLAENCYYEMFYDCSSLKKAPELPAMTLQPHCYDRMFRDCRGLIEGPKLPATEIAEYCYFYMFQSCSSLVIAPKILPAMELETACYCGMFVGCSSLEKAPELPAVNVVGEGWPYSSTFQGCSKLNYLKVGFGTQGSTDWPTGATNGWLSGAGTNATNPTFYWRGNTELERSVGTVPENWAIVSY